MAAGASGSCTFEAAGAPGGPCGNGNCRCTISDIFWPVPQSSREIFHLYLRFPARTSLAAGSPGTCISLGAGGVCPFRVCASHKTRNTKTRKHENTKTQKHKRFTGMTGLFPVPPGSCTFMAAGSGILLVFGCWGSRRSVRKRD
jgi:hypothetical protein